MKNYYQILETHYNATPEVLKTAYRTCAKKYHPDLQKENQEFYNACFVEINEAYSVLSNETLRDDYELQFIKFYKIDIYQSVSINEDIFKIKNQNKVVEIRSDFPFLKNKFEINNEYILWKKHKILIQEIEKISFGLHSRLFDNPLLFLSFLSKDGRLNFIDFRTSLVPQDYLVNKFNEIVTDLTRILFPTLLSKMISKLDSGIVYPITNSISITRQGLLVPKEKVNFISWQNLKISEQYRKYYNSNFLYKFHLSDNQNSKFKLTYKPYKFLNASFLKEIHNFYCDNHLPVQNHFILYQQ